MLNLLLAVSPWLAFVYDYSPAPGQFINEVPEITSELSQARILETVAEQLVGSKMPGMVSLGSYGGNITIGFDHPVINMPGEADFMIYGNAITNGAEPGIVMVSRDDNGNGIPDDTWYELRGSLEDDPAIDFNYSITYYKPETKAPVKDENWKFVSDAEYIKWEDNRGTTGYVMKLTSHTQSYWPEWIDAEALTFAGTRLPDIAVSELPSGTLWTATAPEWGYADSRPNNQQDGFDIGNAVDADRNPVYLDHIDFIRVYSATNQFRGWLGESSTEISGGEDLHPGASGIDAASMSRTSVKVCGRTLIINTLAPRRYEILNMAGQIVESGMVVSGENIIDLNIPEGGIYFAKCEKVVKFAL